MRNTSFLPMFPLGIVVFPGENLNLHIFEPRYLQLIQECEEEGKTFGIPSFIDKKLSNFGTEVKLLNIEKTYANGELDIKTQGVGLFQIMDFSPKIDDKLYGGAEVEFLEYDTDSELFTNQKIYEYIYQLFEVLKINKPLPALDADFNTYLLGHLVGFNIDQEYEFLRIRSEESRQSYMLKHLEHLLPVIKEMHTLQERAKLNGHFKHLDTPDLMS
jgi:hypothetical protein